MTLLNLTLAKTCLASTRPLGESLTGARQFLAICGKAWLSSDDSVMRGTGYWVRESNVPAAGGIAMLKTARCYLVHKSAPKNVRSGTAANQTLDSFSRSKERGKGEGGGSKRRGGGEVPQPSHS